LAYGKEIHTTVKDIFIENPLIFMYRDKYDYLEKNKFIFNNPIEFGRELIKNY
jgi:hypothetical protein